MEARVQIPPWPTDSRDSPRRPYELSVSGPLSDRLRREIYVTGIACGLLRSPGSWQWWPQEPPRFRLGRLMGQLTCLTIENAVAIVIPAKEVEG